MKSARKIYFLAIAASILMTSLPVLQSCSNDNDNISTTDNKVKSKLKCVSPSKIPEGVKPYTVKNEEELVALIKKIDEMEIVIKNESEIKKSQNKRFKVVATEYHEKDFLTFDIVLKITANTSTGVISHHSSLSGFHPGVTWVETQADFTWGTPRTSYDYEVSGDLSAWIYVGTQLTYYTKEKVFKGTNVI